MTDENYQGVGDNGVGGSWGTGDSVTAAILTEIEKRVDDELKKFKAGIQGDGVISGLTVTEKGAGANQSVDVASGSCTIGGTKYTEAGTVNVALDAAHGTYARWDIITYDASAGDPSKVTGTAGAIPTIPDVASGDIILALVLRAANDNVVSDAEITDKRIMFTGNAFLLASIFDSDGDDKIETDVLLFEKVTESDTILAEDISTHEESDASYVKQKSFRVPFNITKGEVRVTVELDRWYADTACAIIVINGITKGSEQCGDNFDVKTWNDIPCAVGQEIELHTKGSGGNPSHKWRNFKIKGTKSDVSKDNWDL